MKLIYPAIFSPLEEMPGYCVTFPDLPGCVTQGSNLEEAITMAADAASGWVLDEWEDGNPTPESSRLSDIITENAEDFVNLIVLDMDSYAEKYGQKAIRKNCTIPAWLNTMAERKGVNFSAVLQRALMEQLGVSK